MKSQLRRLATSGLAALTAATTLNPQCSAAPSKPKPPPSCRPVVRERFSRRGSLRRVHCIAMHPLAVCGPSGAGKSTLISMLRKEFPDDFGFSVSHTTRGPRPGERDGVDYHFSEKAAMEAGIADGKFLESANVHGNLYGTSFEAISSVAEHHRVCVLDIDVQGVESCRRAGFDAAAFIFIAPPSLGSLEARLRKRGTETEERIRKRLDGAVHELAASERMAWDARIVNDDLDEAYARLRVAVEGARTACRSTRDEALD